MNTVYVSLANYVHNTKVYNRPNTLVNNAQWQATSKANAHLRSSVVTIASAVAYPTAIPSVRPSVCHTLKMC